MPFTTKIIAATDLSPASLLAVDAAAVLARTFGAEVFLLFVYDPKLLAPFYAIPALRALEDATEDGGDFETAVRRELEHIRNERLRGVASVTVALEPKANAADGICAFAKSVGADLIVVGTHGRSALDHLLIGSVAEKVVRHAPCPVLTLRSHAA